MRTLSFLALTGCFFGSISSTSDGGTRSERSLAFVVPARVSFEHLETPSGSGEETVIATDGSPPEVTVTLTEEYEVLFTGTLNPGTVEFGLELEHIWDGPSDMEFWTVSITAQ
ncbi:MAG: hypothetical protein KC912_08510 [Proteobacteria bacterium]|nr:hypothetical protein [Pseudomonadota bacterium]